MDSIGDTVISVAWVLSVLVRAVDRVSRPTSYGGGDHEQMNKSGVYSKYCEVGW